MNSENYKVEVYSWDLKGVPKAVLKGLSKVSDMTDGAIPKEYLHVGIAVYNRFYHFNQTGLQVNMEIPKNFNRCGSINYTTKSHTEFETWFTTQRNNYRGDTYDMIRNNCINFAADACEFLDVPFEGPQTQLNQWLALYEKQLRPFEEKILRSGVLKAFGVPSVKSKNNRTCVDSAHYTIPDSSDEDSNEDAYAYESNNNGIAEESEDEESEVEFVLID